MPKQPDDSRPLEPPLASSRQPTAVVIGGGVIGCCAAYYLSKLGWHVRLVEAGRVGRGSSHGNCGFICPSHVLPLTLPGTLWPVMKRMFRRDSAMYLKPRWDPALWAWLMRFARTCRRADVLQVAAARHALLTTSMSLYRKLLADESLEIEWEDRGLLLVFKTPHEFAEHERIAALVHKEFNIETRPLDAAQLIEFEPALRRGPAGGWHYTGDAHLRPDRLMSALAGVLRSRGVEILEETSVSRITLAGGRARAVETAAGTLEADAVVLAAGARSSAFATQLGCRIPIQPGKGYSITWNTRRGELPPPRTAPRTPIIFEEFHVAVTPWASGIRVGSTMEFAGYDSSINQRRIALFKRVAEENLVEAPQGPIEEEWCGWRPMTFDDLPCIGPAPKVPNVIIAAGHGMVGMATAPASGKLAAELVAGEKPHIDPTPYALRRFEC